MVKVELLQDSALSDHPDCDWAYPDAEFGGICQYKPTPRGKSAERKRLRPVMPEDTFLHFKSGSRVGLYIYSEVKEKFEFTTEIPHSWIMGYGGKPNRWLCFFPQYKSEIKIQRIPPNPMKFSIKIRPYLQIYKRPITAVENTIEELVLKVPRRFLSANILDDLVQTELPENRMPTRTIFKLYYDKLGNLFYEHWPLFPHLSTE